MNGQSGQLEYATGECGGLGQPVPCLQYCKPPRRFTLDGVVAAEAQTFSDRWPLPPSIRNLHDVSGANPFESGEQGRWRPSSEYAYRTDVRGGSAPSERVYLGAGVFDEYALFDYGAPEQLGENWLRLTETIQYGPNGTALEERDLRGTYSAVRAGPLHQRPYLVAANAPRASVLFESFEEGAASGADPGAAYVLSDGLHLSTSEGELDESGAHAGRRSFHLKMETGRGGRWREGRLTLSRGFPTLGGGSNTGGYVVKLWVRAEWSPGRLYADTLALELRPANPVTGNLSIAFPVAPFEPVARVGEWVLYEAAIDDPAAGQTGTAIQISVRAGNPGFPSAGIPADVWLDDVRVQPIDAEMTAHVYDPTTLRLVASFDDQHFGVYYQYDGEGRLVREIRETERGMKTLQEGHYHTPEVDRPPHR